MTVAVASGPVSKKNLQANVITDKTQLISALQNKHVHIGPEPESNSLN